MYSIFIILRIIYENDVKFSIFYSGWVFAASNSDVWLLHAVSFPEQISQLLAQKQFELALHMAVCIKFIKIFRFAILNWYNNLIKLME